MVALIAQSQVPELVSISLTEFLRKELPPRENILEPWLPTSGLAMVYAKRGVGKTFVALEVMMAVAYGTQFLSFKAPKPRKVVLIDGEMSGVGLQERLRSIRKRMPVTSEMIEPTIITPDLQYGAMPNLSTPEGQQAIEKDIADADLIIVDNLSTLTDNGSNENDAQCWRDIQAWALRQRQKRKSVLFIHHASKSGGQRGTSKKEDVLDTVICLKPPADYEPSMGACFELHFEKSRGIMGTDVTPLQCRLAEDDWEFHPLEDCNYEKVVELMNSDLKQCEIAEEIGLSKGQVSKLVKKAKSEGKLL